MSDAAKRAKAALNATSVGMVALTPSRAVTRRPDSSTKAGNPASLSASQSHERLTGYSPSSPPVGTGSGMNHAGAGHATPPYDPAADIGHLGEDDGSEAPTQASSRSPGRMMPPPSSTAAISSSETSANPSGVGSRSRNPQSANHTLGKYKVLRLLGRGGMASVYEGRDPADQAVAIKVLSRKLLSNPKALPRFRAEAEAALRLNHPNVVKVFEVANEGRVHFIVMELLPGGSLAGYLKTQGAFRWTDASRITLDVARALEQAHALGMVHRDIKPSNLLVSAEGIVKLADFGVAKVNDPADADTSQTRGLTQTGQVMGTPEYMSPEQCQCDAALDARTDIYSLGATYFALLTGSPPYPEAKSTPQAMFAHCYHPVPNPRDVIPDLPEGCARIVRRAMAKHRDERYPNTKRLIADLEALITDPEKFVRAEQQDWNQLISNAVSFAKPSSLDRPPEANLNAGGGANFLSGTGVSPPGFDGGSMLSGGTSAPGGAGMAGGFAGGFTAPTGVSPVYGADAYSSGTGGVMGAGPQGLAAAPSAGLAYSPPHLPHSPIAPSAKQAQASGQASGPASLGGVSQNTAPAGERFGSGPRLAKPQRSPSQQSGQYNPPGSPDSLANPSLGGLPPSANAGESPLAAGYNLDGPSHRLGSAGFGAGLDSVSGFGSASPLGRPSSMGRSANPDRPSSAGRPSGTIRPSELADLSGRSQRFANSDTNRESSQPESLSEAPTVQDFDSPPRMPSAPGYGSVPRAFPRPNSDLDPYSDSYGDPYANAYSPNADVPPHRGGLSGTLILLLILLIAILGGMIGTVIYVLRETAKPPPPISKSQDSTQLQPDLTDEPSP